MKINQKKNILVSSIVLTSTIVCFYCIQCFLNRNDKVLNLSLEYGRENKKELEKVIDHYKKNQEDSLKLKAALFLLENIQYHYWQTNLNEYDNVFDSIANVPLSVDINVRRDLFKNMLASVNSLNTVKIPSKKYDAQSLNSKFLIENIDLAFEAWYKYKPQKRADFKTFCHYILPYRNKDEPVDTGMRREFMETYNWVFDFLNAGASLKSVADSIITNFKHENLLSLRSLYPIPLSPRQYEKSRIGLCQDGVTYFVNLFRALGIASTDDFVSHWGNHHSSGHNWLRLTFDGEIYFEHATVKNNYKNESIPKVYRTTFGVNSIDGDLALHKDVTSEYKETVDVEVPIIFNTPKNNEEKGVVCVFDARRQWYKVAEGQIIDDKLILKEIGTNVVYFPAYYVFGRLHPINYPFFVGLDKSITYFKPKGIHESVELLRKSGMMPYRDKDWKQSWINDLNNTEIQTSNDSLFQTFKVLAKIDNFNSTHPQTINLKNEVTFKYLRIYNKNEIFLARLDLIDANGREVDYSQIDKGKIAEINWEGASDEDPLTYSSITEFSSGLKLDGPSSIIKSIRFQARNDDNHIRIGDQYELYYWDTVWKSLGRKTATDTLLLYNNLVPKNSLLWLRNISRGREENAFTTDKYGRQVWLGFYH